MKDANRTKADLISELRTLRRRVAALEAAATVSEEGARWQGAMWEARMEAFEAAMDGMVLLDANGNMVDMNSAYEAMVGRSREELAGRNGMEVVSLTVRPDYVDQMAEGFRLALAGQPIPPLRTILMHRNGREVPVYITASFLRDAEGKPKAVVAVIKNITELDAAEKALREQQERLEEIVKERLSELEAKNRQLQQQISERARAEKELRESEQKVRAIFDHSWEFIGLMTTDGTLIAANRTSLEFAGIQASDVLGRPFWDTPWWTHSTEMQERLRAGVQAAASGELVRFDATHAAADGTVHTMDFSLKPVKDETGRVVLLIPEGRDITERKRAEEALRESEENFRALAENAHDAILIGEGEEGRHVYVNRMAAEITGYSIPELMRMGIKDLVHPDDLATMVTRYGDRRAGRAVPTRYETRIVRKDGATVFVEVSATQTLWHGKTVSMGALRDVTDRRRTEDELRKFKTMSDNANYGTAIADLDGTLIYVNGYFAGVHGYAPEDLVGKNLFVLHTEEQQAFVEQIIQSMKETGSFQALEVWHKHRNGAVFPMLMNGVVIKDAQGIPFFLAATATDITDRKRAEEALRESEERYRTLAEAAQDIIYIVNREDVVEYVNGYAARMLGLRPEQIIGRPRSQLFPPEISARQRSHLRQVLETGRPVRVESTMTYQHREVWQDTYLVPLMGEGGKPRAVLGISRDITDRKRVAELSQRIIHTQEDLLSHISRELHDEVGQLLTAIDIELETVQKVNPSASRGLLDGLERVKGVSHAAVGAVRRLCRQLRSPIIEEVGLVGAMQTHIDDFANRTGIEVRFECSIEKSGISHEAAIGFFRIMQEALTNVARHANATRVQIALGRKGQQALLEISDNGQGFNPDDTPPHSSSGLQGMRERAELMGGTLAIESAPGRGAQIHVTAPLVSGPKAAPM